MHALDIIVQNYLSLARTPTLTAFMYLLSELFDVTIAAFIVTVCTAFLIGLLRGVRYGVLFIGSITAGAITAYLLKIIFQVVRPADSVITVFGPSFPSYHAVVASIFFLMIVYIFDGYLPRIGRILLNACCVFLALLVGFSRLYLGVHWLSDVLAGFCIGTVIFYIALSIFRCCNKTVRRQSI